MRRRGRNWCDVPEVLARASGSRLGLPKSAPIAVAWAIRKTSTSCVNVVPGPRSQPAAPNAGWGPSLSLTGCWSVPPLPSKGGHGASSAQ